MVGGYTSDGSVWNRLIGTVGEVVAIVGPLTDSEREKMEGYLAWKWGLQASLPSTHPYYYTKPPPNRLKVNPLNYLNALFWLDAADLNGDRTIPSSGSLVRSWMDKSNSGKQVYLTTGGSTSLCPTFTYDGTYPAVQFSGAQYLITNQPVYNVFSYQQYSIFVVCRATNTPGNNNTVLLYARTAVSNALNSLVFAQINTSNNGGNTQVLLRYNSTTTKTTTIVPAVTGKQLISVCDNGLANNTRPFLFSNGTAIDVTSTVGTTNLSGSDQGRVVVGCTVSSGTASTFFTGYVYEVIILTRNVTAVERRQIEGYLAWKWGLNTTLPTTHPFYKISP
jgi:hypothetical protein